MGRADTNIQRTGQSVDTGRPRSEHAPFASCLSMGLAGALLLVAALAPEVARAGAASGTSFHRTVVLDPIPLAARFIYPSDGTDCDAAFDPPGGLFQAVDFEGNACVPAFVRDGAGLALLRGAQTVSTCILPEGGGLESIALTVATVFSTSDNPGLAADLVLPTQVFSGGGIDPEDSECGGNFEEPGASIPGTGWFPVPNPSCIRSSIRYEGMILPIDGSQAGATIPERLAGAADEAFSQVSGFEAVPLIMEIEVDAGGTPIGTDGALAPSLGPAPLPPCAGGAATAERFQVDVYFAQPAGFVPPVPLVPSLEWLTAAALIGSLALVGGWLARRAQATEG